MRKLGMGLGLLLAVGCAHHQDAKLDDSGLAKLNNDQMGPVDDARLELGRAQDMASKARANEADAKARVEVGKSEREVGEAQVKRAAAQRDLLKKQYADQNAMAQAEQDVSAAQEATKAQDAKLAYLNQNVAACAAERNAAEAHVLTQEAVVEQSKYQAMQQGGAPQTASIDPAKLDSRLAEARNRENEARKQAMDRRTQAKDLYDRWARVDSKASATPQGAPPAAQTAQH
jgi:hypothetical protein